MRAHVIDRLIINPYNVINRSPAARLLLRPSAREPDEVGARKVTIGTWKLNQYEGA